MVVNADGSGKQALTGPLRDPGDFGLMARSLWSPTGDRIAYAEGLYGQRRLHVLRLADGQDTVLAQGTTAAWSPDGTKIALLWKEPTLAVIDADGAHLHVLDQKATDGYRFWAAWSPGSRWIAYRRTSVGDDLWIARADGTHRRRLTRCVQNEEIGPIYWSRNGQTILYTHIVQQGD